MEKNPFYKHSSMKLFLAEENGAVVGRIGAIINENHNTTYNDSIGFFGFFECADRQDVANALFDAAGAWLKERGMTHVRGPVNPSMNDECGLLVDGFDRPPVVLMTYNPAYYTRLIEQYGFTKEMDMYAYLLKQENYKSEKMVRLLDLVKQRSGVQIRSMNFKDKAQFTRDVQTIKSIYNSAWEKNWGFVKFTDEEFDFLAADLKQIADPDLVLFAEVEGKAVGFCLALPDINQTLIHNKKGGLLGGIWHLLTKKKSINLCRIIVLGLLEEYRRSGMDIVLYAEVGARALKKGMNGEASWILESNDAMNKAATNTMHGERYKTYRIYQKPL